jgi:hypothetical protein
LEAPDAHVLARFYSELLKWPLTTEEPRTAMVAPPEGFVYLGFQTADDYVRPVWPATPRGQRITMHLEFEVEDLAVAVADAERLGAVLASYQSQANVRVMLDPAGHPFCLYLDESSS